MSVPVIARKGAGSPLALLLVLEASTAAGSVALIANGALVALRPVVMGAGREDHLFPAVQALLDDVGAKPKQLNGIVCGSGPGSFTSLRIGASLAKGLAHGESVPLFAVSSLLLAAADAIDDCPVGPAVVHGDALRGERYVLDVTFGVDGRVCARSALQRLTLDQLDVHSGTHPRLAVLASPTPALESRVVTPSAAHLVRLVPASWSAEVPLDSWEPEYGRLAEAQVKWEASHGAPLPAHGEA